MPVVNNGVNLVQWQLERAKSQVQQGQVLLMSAANAAKGRLHGDSREASILRAGQMDLLLPEYPMAVAMLTNAHTRGRGAVPNLPDGEMEDHEAALRTAYALLGFLANTEPNSVLQIGSVVAGEVNAAPAAVTASSTAPPSIACDQCGKTFTRIRYRDTHVEKIHSVPLTPPVYDRDNPVCWGKARCRYTACIARKVDGYLGEGCNASLNSLATRQAHDEIVKDWGDVYKRTERRNAGEDIKVAILVAALKADVVFQRFLTKHRQFRPRGKDSTEFGGLGTVQAGHIKTQVSRLLELELKRKAGDTSIRMHLQELDSEFYGEMRDTVIPAAIARWNEDNRKRKSAPGETPAPKRRQK